MAKGLSDHLLTYEQVAGRAQCSVTTVRRLIRQGAPVCVLGPKTHRFDWPSFSEWLRRKRRWRPKDRGEIAKTAGQR